MFKQGMETVKKVAKSIWGVVTGLFKFTALAIGIAFIFPVTRKLANITLRFIFGPLIDKFNGVYDSIAREINSYVQPIKDFIKEQAKKYINEDKIREEAKAFSDKVISKFRWLGEGLEQVFMSWKSNLDKATRFVLENFSYMSFGMGLGGLLGWFFGGPLGSLVGTAIGAVVGAVVGVIMNYLDEEKTSDRDVSRFQHKTEDITLKKGYIAELNKRIDELLSNVYTLNTDALMELAAITKERETLLTELND